MDSIGLKGAMRPSPINSPEHSSEDPQSIPPTIANMNATAQEVSSPCRRRNYTQNGGRMPTPRTGVSATSRPPNSSSWLQARHLFILFFILNVLAFFQHWKLMPYTVARLVDTQQQQEQQQQKQQQQGPGSNADILVQPIQQSSASSSPSKSTMTSNVNYVPRIHYSRPTVLVQQPHNTFNSTHSNNHDASGSSSSSSSGSRSSSNKFAYAFLLGGALSDRPGSDYRGGLYSVVAAVHSLRRHGSRSDMVLMVQVSARSRERTLPPLEEEVLRRMNIHVQYLPKYSSPKFETFYSLMMEKFRILTLEQYDRVLYLDYDVLPGCNLDYLMELSSDDAIRRPTPPRHQPLLKENVILAYLQEPASGGFFILKPNRTDYDRLVHDVIQKREERALELPYPHWDVVEGWGHTIVPPDSWRTARGDARKHTNWTWYGSHADQGLLYYWTKYVQQSVSIVVAGQVEQWGVDPANRRLVLERIDHGTLGEHSCSNGSQYPTGAVSAAPYRDFTHLTGKDKPWHHSREALEVAVVAKRNWPYSKYSPLEQWYWSLKDALRETGMEGRVPLDFIKGEVENPAVGRSPAFAQMAAYLKAKRGNGWRQYEYEEEAHNTELVNRARAAAGLDPLPMSPPTPPNRSTAER